MVRLFSMLTLLLAGIAAAGAAEICGNPCADGYVWTDRNMGMCIPETPMPPQPSS